MLLPRIKGSNIKYGNNEDNFDTSSLTYRKDKKLNKALFSPEESSKVDKSRFKTSSLIPYASNISNAFRKLPKPVMSELERPTTANLINLDAARNAIDVDQRNLNRETDYKVANPAVSQAIKATILGKSIQGKSEGRSLPRFFSCAARPLAIC